MDDWLEIGRIVAPQGLNGEVRVYPSSDFPERFLEPGERWLLRPNATEPESIQLQSGRFLEGKGLYVLKIQGIRYRDQSEKLRGATLLVPESDRPWLDDDEYHVMDLLGLPVFHHHTGIRIGTVQDVIPAGNDLLEVVLDTGAPDDKNSTEPGSLQGSHPESDAPLPDVSHPSMRKKARRHLKKLKSKKGKKKTKMPTVLIPFVPEIVPIVDLDAGRITVDPPPGLLNAPDETRSDSINLPGQP